MANALVKLHNGEGIAPRSILRGWDLAQGSLVYTDSNRNLMGSKFRNAINFQIYDNSFGKPDTTPFFIAWGKYEGKTELFSATNYFHQRTALTGSFGETGNKGFDTAWKAVSSVANWQDTVGKAIVGGKTKFFVGFFSTHNGEPTRVMHNQTFIGTYRLKGKTTPALVFNTFRDMFL